MKRLTILSLLIAMLALTSCGNRYRKDNPNDGSEFTLGQVQMKVKRGMSQADVAEALGSPNIVTQDKDGMNTWIYDKMSTSVQYYDSGGGFWLVVVGAGGNRGAATSNQKTLTVVIKFNDHNQVENLTYHSSRF